MDQKGSPSLAARRRARPAAPDAQAAHGRRRGAASRSPLLSPHLSFQGESPSARRTAGTIMKLTRASSYALHAVAFMAQQKQQDKPVASHNIAAARTIP